MPGLVPGIRDFSFDLAFKTWMPGINPGMTKGTGLQTRLAQYACSSNTRSTWPCQGPRYFSISTSAGVRPSSTIAWIGSR